jgi:hypothetical protein
MYRIGARNHLGQLAPYLSGIKKSQVPFALAQTMNKIADDVKKDVWPAVLERELDRPNPTTKKGTVYTRATKNNPRVFIYFKPFVEKYILPQILGGPIIGGAQSPGYEAVPYNLRTNKYGNIGGLKGGRLSRLLKDGNHFRKKIKGVDGIWRRYPKSRRNPNGRIKLVVMFGKNFTYTPKLRTPLQRSVLQYVTRKSQPIFARELRRAIKKNPAKALATAQKMGLV